MDQKLFSSSRTVILPRYAQGGFKPAVKPNESKNYSLDGTLWVDFINNRDGWTITFAEITKQDFDDIKAIYDDQYTNQEFLRFTDDQLGINTLVHMEMQDEYDLVWNKTVVQGLWIKLEPRDASS